MIIINLICNYNYIYHKYENCDIFFEVELHIYNTNIQYIHIHLFVAFAYSRSVFVYRKTADSNAQSFGYFLVVVSLPVSRLQKIF